MSRPPYIARIVDQLLSIPPGPARDRAVEASLSGSSPNDVKFKAAEFAARCPQIPRRARGSSR